MSDEFSSPSSVMYTRMKQSGISNKDLAALLFAPGFKYGGTPLHDRMTDRTFLTRNVVHVEPGTFPEQAFGNFAQSAERISGMLLSKCQEKEDRHALVAHFSGAACEDMCTALRACGQNDAVYRNITSRVEQMELSNDADKLALLVLQFISTGCLGNAARATEITLARSRQILNASFRTDIAVEGEGASVESETGTYASLGLCRISGGSLVMPAYPLSSEPEGTEIGSLATTAGAINDVGETVSKRHARVFCDGSGHWFVEGLGSTNGTTIVRGDTKQREVVEPPRADREPNKNYPPVRIYPSDTLCLADTTQFMVVALAE